MKISYKNILSLVINAYENPLGEIGEERIISEGDMCDMEKLENILGIMGLKSRYIEGEHISGFCPRYKLVMGKSTYHHAKTAYKILDDEDEWIDRIRN